MAKQKKQSKQKNTPTTKKSSASKKVSKYEYDGKLSVVIAPFNEELPTVKSYIKKLMASVTASEIIVVGDFQAEEEALGNEDYAVQFLGNVSIKEGVAASTGDQLLVVDDLSISPRNLVTWLQSERTVPKNEIWNACRHHSESEFSDGYKLNIWAWLLNLLTRLMTGIVTRDLRAGFRLFPADMGRDLFANLGKANKNYATELMHLAKLYDVEVKDMPVTMRGEAVEVAAPEAFMGSISAWGKSWGTWIKHYFVHPAKDVQSEYFAKKESPWFRLAFAVTAVLLFVMMPMLSSDFGMTADEHVQNEYGNLLLKYYDTDGENFDALFYKDLYNYGGLFDYLAAWCNDRLGFFEDPYDMRHFLNSLFGAFLMLFVGLTGRLAMGSWLGGLLALLFVALSPRLFGHSMNNPKDIPFAAAYIFTVYHSIRFTQQLPKPTLRTSLAVIIGIAAAINIRIGGLLLIAYLAAFSGITFLWKPELRKRLFDIKLMVTMLLIGGLIAFVGLWAGSIFWPYAALDWLNNPLKVLDKMSHYYVGIRVLFDSTNFWSDTVPWNYIPNWMLYTTPLFVLIGLIASPIMGFLRRAEGKSLNLVLVAFAGFFPICYVIYQKSGLYDAMRHMLFAYSLFPILAAFTWYSAIKLFDQKAIKMAIAGAMIVLMALPTMFMLRNHPYQYTYFNELIGGNNGAFKKYESDYWMVGMKRASTWYIENIAAKNPQDTFVVATNCIYPIMHYLKDKGNIQYKYVRYHEREKQIWDYGIFYSRFINRKFLISEAWPPGEVIHAEKVDDVPIAVVVKRKSDRGALAGIAFSKKDWPTAITLLETIVAENPKNESALLLLAQSYSQIGQWEGMKGALDKLLAISDMYSNTWGMLGIYYLNVKNQEEARKAFEKATEINYKYTFGQYHLARMYAQEKNFDAAIKRLELFDAYGGKPVQGYDLAIQIAQQLNNDGLRYYFTAKKLSINKDWNGAMSTLQNSLNIDPAYEPALKMERNYNDAVAQQTLKQALTNQAKAKGK